MKGILEGTSWEVSKFIDADSERLIDLYHPRFTSVHLK